MTPIAGLLAAAIGSVSNAAEPLPGTIVRVSPTAGTQNEPSIGINPTDPSNLVAGSIHNLQCGVYDSSDSGETWGFAVLPLSTDAAFTNAGDPVIEFADNGTAYYLCMNTANNNAQKSQYVYRSTDGGQTWNSTPPVIAITPTFGNDDKGHIVADNHPSSPFFGNVYVAATALGSGSLRFARSIDGAQSFQAPITVNDANIGFAVNLAVGADGAVYAAWSREVTVGVSNAVLVDRSDDGGVSFGALTGGTDHVIQGTGIVLGGVRPEPNRGNGSPYIGTHPTDPNIVYAVWAEDAPGADDSDIRFSRSTDRGDTWSPSVRLNVDVNPPGDFASQFWPTLAVDPIDGSVNVIWYSDENDPNRADATSLIDLYFASSADAGLSLSFSTPVRVTQTSSAPFGFFGDYLGIDTYGGVAHPIWTDTTFTIGNQDVATTQIGGADLSIASIGADGPAEMTVGSSSTYDVAVVIANAGPVAPVDADVDVAAQVSPGLGILPATQTTSVPDVDIGEPRSVVTPFDVSCIQPGSHTITFTASVLPTDPATTDPNPANDGGVANATVACIVPIAINVNPGSLRNPVSIAESAGVIPVAVLTTAVGEYGLPVAVDASSIDVSTVRFGPPDVLAADGGAPEVHGRGHPTDSRELDEITRDGDVDLLLHFRTRDASIVPGTTELCVRGALVLSGITQQFVGCDHVEIVP